MTASIRIGPLLPYQLEALRLVANGLTDREIARVTGRSQDTVRTRVRRCCELLGAKSRPHAVALAMGAGLIQSGDISRNTSRASPGARSQPSTDLRRKALQQI